MARFSVAQLATFYRQQGIAVDGFRCPHKALCRKAAAPRNLHHGAEALVGERYGTPLRIVVVSLSMANGSRRLEDRTADSEWLQDPATKLNQHMRGTLDILQAILPEISGRKAFGHFSLTNAAKCSLKGTGNKSPDECFVNCARFVLPELEVLAPRLVISQGRQAGDPLRSTSADLRAGVLEKLVANCTPRAHPLVKGMLREIFNEHLHMLRTQTLAAVWLELVHPSARGGQWSRIKRLRLAPLLGWATRSLAEQLRP